MIITDDVVMLNFPKTGSSFAREVFKAIYTARASGFRKLLARLGIAQPSLMDLMLPNLDESGNEGRQSQHGTLRQVPAAHRGKPVVSITRNPFLRYVSLYHFGWWQKVPPAPKAKILEQFSRYPDLSFSEFYEFMHIFWRQSRLGGIVPKLDLGVHSIQFILFYFPDPEDVLRKIDRDYIDTGAYREDMGRVHFLRQENLNDDLKQFLLSLGMGAELVKVVDSLGKINVTEKESGDESEPDYFADTWLRERVLERDRLLFSIFPEYLPTNTCARPPSAS